MKTIACLQAGWLVIQCIGRQCQDLPITPLEIVTIAYAANAFLIYGLWWHKPLDIQVPIKVQSEEVPAQVSRINNNNVPCPSDSGFQVLKSRLRVQACIVEAIENFTLRLYSGVGDMGVTGMASAAAVALGAIHIAAWNGDFVSPIEELSVLPVARPTRREHLRREGYQIGVAPAGGIQTD